MSKDTVVLTTVYNPLEAEIIKAKLAKEEIEVFFKQEAIGRLYRLTVNGLGAIDIYVAADKLLEAREIIGPIE